MTIFKEFVSLEERIVSIIDESQIGRYFIPNVELARKENLHNGTSLYLFGYFEIQYQDGSNSLLFKVSPSQQPTWFYKSIDNLELMKEFLNDLTSVLTKITKLRDEDSSNFFEYISFLKYYASAQEELGIKYELYPKLYKTELLFKDFILKFHYDYDEAKNEEADIVVSSNKDRIVIFPVNSDMTDGIIPDSLFEAINSIILSSVFLEPKEKGFKNNPIYEIIKKKLSNENEFYTESIYSTLLELHSYTFEEISNQYNIHRCLRGWFYTDKSNENIVFFQEEYKDMKDHISAVLKSSSNG